MPPGTDMSVNRNNLKQQPIPVVPRNMAIVNADGTPTRSGQLLLQQLQQTSVGYGPAGGAATSGMADGSYYTVQTGGETLYQLQDGEWHYIAGTMWGTLNPDQRPTGLGPNDTGLSFRTTDQPAQQFLWSGSAWVEVDFVLYGTHARRLALVPANIIDAVLFIETDRGNALYEIQAGTWMLIVATMWGTLTPDQRPTDLGVDDAGFEFWATNA